MGGGVGRHGGVVVRVRGGWSVIGKIFDGHDLVGVKKERWMDVEKQLYKDFDLKLLDENKRFHSDMKSLIIKYRLTACVIDGVLSLSGGNTRCPLSEAELLTI